MKKNLKHVLSTALATTMLISLTACNSSATSGNDISSSKNSMKDGSYTASAKGNNGDVKIQVTISKNMIQEIAVLENGETPGLGDTAMDKISKEIINGQTIAVDAVTGATNSSNAVLTAVEDCLKQAGADVESFKLTVEKEKGEDEVKETQVVVVGGGASGTAAALQAAENGAKVIVVEMTSSPAGQGTLAGGLFATNSSEQIEAGETVSDEWYYNQYLVTGNFGINGTLLSKVIQNSGATVDWLENYGCNLTLVHPGTGGSVEHVTTQPASTLHGYAEGGTKAITTLHSSLEELGGEVLYSTTATELLMEDGKAVGIKALKEDGGVLTIKADSVILATGGFGGNVEQVAEVFGEGYGQSMISTNIGTGIEMAISAGADASFEDAITMHYGIAVGNTQWGGALNSALVNPWLFVDVDGNRFMNEESFAFEPIKSSNAIKSLPQNAAYEIFDETLIKIVAEKGAAGITDIYPGELTTDPTKFVELGHEVDSSKNSEALHTPTDVTEELEKLVAEGSIIKADSVQELAEKLGMDNLAETVEQYNKLCATGKDTDHFKSSKYMDKVEGTVYAVKVTPSAFLGTLGGIEINDKCQVLTKEGKAIEGLYSAGSETNGAYGDSYVYFEGGTLGYAYGTGRIAGQNAAKQAINNK